MEKKLIILVLAAICAAEVFSSPASRTLETDKQNAQYYLVKLVSEVNILRMTAYLLIIDINHIIKNMNVELFIHMQAAGVPVAKLDKIKSDARKNTLEINKVYFIAMDNGNALMDQIYLMNNHITYTPPDLVTDMDVFILHLQLSHQSYTDADIILTSFVDNFKLSVETELAAVPAGPEVTAANSYIVEMETLINTGKAECNKLDQRVVSTSIDTIGVLNTYIANNLS